MTLLNKTYLNDSHKLNLSYSKGIKNLDFHLTKHNKIEISLAPTNFHLFKPKLQMC